MNPKRPNESRYNFGIIGDLQVLARDYKEYTDHLESKQNDSGRHLKSIASSLRFFCLCGILGAVFFVLTYVF